MDEISERFREYDRPDFPHGCIKEKPCLSIDLDVQEIERLFRCLAIENILERLHCFLGDFYSHAFLSRFSRFLLMLVRF